MSLKKREPQIPGDGRGECQAGGDDVFLAEIKVGNVMYLPTEMTVMPLEAREANEEL